ncbi:MAG: MoaD/ThiS family protein, partial [Actinomycetota bacterium]
MELEVRIPAMLRRLTGEARAVKVSGGTIGEVINNLDSLHAGIRNELLAGDGSIHRFVNIYLNDEDIRFLSGLDTPIGDGDTVSILPA